MSGQPFISERNVAFGDTDMAGIVHFSRLLDYVEETVHALFAVAGIPVIGSGSLWPKVRVEVDFKAPARFGETLQIILRLARLGASTLTFDFRLERQGRLISEGKWVICHARRAEGEIRAEPIPAAWAVSLRSFFGAE